MKKLTAMLFSLIFVLGVQAQVLTVAQALEIGNALENNEVTSDEYTIEGYVNVITDNSFSSSWNNMTFWIADTRGTKGSSTAGALQCYRCRPDRELVVGDKVRVVAPIKKWNSTIETNGTNAPVTWLESAPEMPVLDTVRGNLRVCAQNLENYYYNYTASSRPKYSDEEGFRAKTLKIVNAMLAIDADIYAFCEVEAKPIVLAQLADSMNAHAGVAGRYAAVSDGIDYTIPPSTDNQIKSGFIYRTDRVKTYGSNTGGTSGNGYYAHTMRIQAFEQLSSGERIVVSMNHFKAKDSSADQGESTRLSNANSLINSLNNISTDPDILILGDLNCQYGEAPITNIINAGYEEQILRFDSAAYSHCYDDGELIDHVLANPSMKEQIVCAYVKHVSAYKCNPDLTYSDSYSDHDPYVVEINLPEGSAGDQCSGSYLATGESGLGDMSCETISGSSSWSYNSSYGAVCNAKGGESWLLTPTFNYSQAQSVTLEFEHVVGYAIDMPTQQTLWVTPNFSTVAGSEWHQLTIPTYPTGTNWTYVKATVDVPLSYVGDNTAFGFKYAVPNEGSNTPKWEIKNLKVTGDCTTTAINEVELAPKAQKIIVNGQMFLILPDGSTYNIMGQKIQ